MKLKLIILPLCLIVVNAFAFEGSVRQSIKNYNGTGTNVEMTWYLSSHGCRVDMAATGKDVNSNTVLLFDPTTKTLKTYEANASGAQKFYFQVNASSISGDVSIISVNPTQEVKQIQGYKSEKWVVVTSKGTFNVWITRDIDFDWSAYKDFFKSSAEIQALAQQGVKGFPMMTEAVGGSNAASVEAVAAQTLSGTTFAVPTGYTLFSQPATSPAK
jgi:hypothetical protein